MSIFVGATTAQFDAALFEKMTAIARAALQGKNGNNTQALVLHTDKGEYYCSVIQDALSADRTDENELLNQLIANDDTCVQHVLCMWQNGDVDLLADYAQERIRSNVTHLGYIIFDEKQFAELIYGYYPYYYSTPDSAQPELPPHKK